jgi:SAM-dependent methyltransferase
VRLARTEPDAVRCPSCGVTYFREDGIWRFLQPSRREHFQRFVDDYERVRAAEGRGSEEAAFYRGLPFVDLSGRFRDQWSIRARSFTALRDRVLPKLVAEHNRALRIVDLGAGNAWLSNRLALLGHEVAAVDLLTNGADGLGAWRHYEARFLCAQAEFERLPMMGGGLDMVVFNASLHYSTSYPSTLREALRVLGPDGRVVVLDSPIYRDARSGERMLRERQEAFVRAHGTRSDALPCEGFLTWSRIDALGTELGIRWTILRPYYGLPWALSPMRARLLGQREPARFALLVGERVIAASTDRA